MPSTRTWSAPLVFVLASVLAVAACERPPVIAGKPCSADADCGGDHYCQLEVEPHVCLPGQLGLPAPADHAPVVVASLVVAHVDQGEVAGRFEAIDLEGEPFVFEAVSSTVRTSEGDEVGAFSLAADGAFTFAPRADLAADAAGVVELRVREPGSDGLLGRGRAYVQALASPPSPTFRFFTGAESDSFLVAENWEPVGPPPGPADTILVGVAGDEAMVLEGGRSRDVQGVFTTTGARVVLGSDRRGATLRTRAPAILLGGVVEQGTLEIDAAPALARSVALAGRAPTTTLRFGAALAAPWDATGDVLVRGALGLDLEGTTLRTTGDLRRVEGGGPVVVAGRDARLLVGGDLVLEGDVADRFEEGLVAIGGDLVVEGASLRPTSDLVIRFDGASADGPSQKAALDAPDSSYLEEVEVAATSSLVLTSGTKIRGTLHVAGGIGFLDDGDDAPNIVEVDTLILRPSAFLAPDSAAGTIRARRCAIAARLPGLIEGTTYACGALVAPIERPEPPDDDEFVDGGVDLPRCPASTDGNTRHALVVAPKDLVGTVGDALVVALPGARFHPLQRPDPTGDFALSADGTFTFDPSGVAGAGEVPFSYDYDVDVGDAEPWVAGAYGCAEIRTADTGAMNTLIGADWDDPYAWSAKRVPTEADAVFVGSEPVVRPDGPPLQARELWIASGVLLDSAGRDVEVGDRLLVGGQLAVGAATARLVGAAVEVAGRIDRLACPPVGTRVVAGLNLGALVVEDGGGACGFEVHRARISAPRVDSPVAVRLDMTGDGAALVVDGDFRAFELGGAMTRGQIVVGGAFAVDDWSQATAGTAHGIVLLGAAPHVLTDLRYGGQLTVAGGDGPLRFEGDSALHTLFAMRPTEVAGTLDVTALVVTRQFSVVDDGSGWTVGTCSGVDVDSAPVCPAP